MERASPEADQLIQMTGQMRAGALRLADLVAQRETAIEAFDRVRDLAADPAEGPAGQDLTAEILGWRDEILRLEGEIEQLILSTRGALHMAGPLV